MSESLTAKQVASLRRYINTGTHMAYPWNLVGPLLDDLAALLARTDELTRERDDFAKAYHVLRDMSLATEARTNELTLAIEEARRGLWWFIERDTGEGWGFDESNVDEIAAVAMRIQDESLGAALAGSSPEEAHDA